MTDIIKKLVMACAKGMDSGYADFCEGDSEMVEELTHICADTERQTYILSYPNKWLDDRTENIVIDNMQIISYLATRLMEQNISLWDSN